MTKRKEGFQLKDKESKQKVTAKKLSLVSIILQVATISLLAWTGKQLLERV